MFHFNCGYGPVNAILTFWGTAVIKFHCAATKQEFHFCSVFMLNCVNSLQLKSQCGGNRGGMGVEFFGGLGIGGVRSSRHSSVPLTQLRSLWFATTEDKVAFCLFFNIYSNVHPAVHRFYSGRIGQIRHGLWSQSCWQHQKSQMDRSVQSFHNDLTFSQLDCESQKQWSWFCSATRPKKIQLHL